jgi:hypothetical protein
MFIVSEDDAAAIRTAFFAEGELSAAIELPLAERKNARAASMSQCSLNITSTSAPEQSMARYK